MKEKPLALEPDNYYHVYNRGNNSENLFYTTDNYQFFLRQFNEYLSPYLDVFAFCLLPNHFHFLVRVKTNNERDSMVDLPGFKNLAGLEHPHTLEKTISQSFSNFFNSYSKAINKQQKRHGSLFEKPFKRKLVTDATYLANLVFYIHTNPQLHGIVADFRMYPWSSFDRILKNTPTRLQKQQVLQWFSSPDNYVAYHSRKADIETIKELIIE